ncbi:replication protein P [Billgrantia pellis]|uniref:replication protein P n=1 Tax=Billgrantia pellis TaxID=2606936 RepID=UPI001658D5AA|nr:replication protein P [Halomonas pellis]
MKVNSGEASNAQAVTEHDVDALFDALKNLYGNKFISQWGLYDEKGLWLAELAHLSVAHLKLGYRCCRERLRASVRQGGEAWPPQPAEFAVLCEPRPEDLGMPNVELAWAEVCEKAHSPANHSWSHLAVRLAARKVTWSIMHSGQREMGSIRERFSQEYLALVNRVMNGQRLTERELLGTDKPLTLVQRAEKRGQEQAMALARSLGSGKVGDAALSKMRAMILPS